MRNFLLAAICCLISIGVGAQELKCTITVNADQVGLTNQQIFKTLERSLNDLVNKTSWSNRIYKDNEKVNAQMFITITEYESNRFKGNIQIQSSRPVFNTSYESPILNFKDNQFNFQYIEFQPLIYNENNMDSNLVAVLSYYAYVILGLDADTFSLEGGNDYFRKAQQIVALSQSGSFAGWSKTSGDRSRFELVDNLMSNSYREYRVAMYNYHRKGLDILSDNNSTGKQVVAGTMRLFETMATRHPNAFLTQTFFDAKAQEIQNIFSDGPKVDVVQLKETLNKIAPLYSSTWNDIKF
ncbi:hypothetical protein KCTC52924_03947 [Arenibacter antarcticus]|uniref:DUF4835 family protein n=1 Tax=Arenibacter antarcticus TaxID=2040469 RepID=A0ABW5VF81_9FLAO|nr:DUF4835 family protein [Arenibacter sp. H213]MCM4169748.1 DUF4835 domain-containing protein [Arenibacter sp. H213]